MHYHFRANNIEVVIHSHQGGFRRHRHDGNFRSYGRSLESLQWNSRLPGRNNTNSGRVKWQR